MILSAVNKLLNSVPLTGTSSGTYNGTNGRSSGGTYSRNTNTTTTTPSSTIEIGNTINAGNLSSRDESLFNAELNALNYDTLSSNIDSSLINDSYASNYLKTSFADYGSGASDTTLYNDYINANGKRPGYTNYIKDRLVSEYQSLTNAGSDYTTKLGLDSTVWNDYLQNYVGSHYDTSTGKYIDDVGESSTIKDVYSSAKSAYTTNLSQLSNDYNLAKSKYGYTDDISTYYKYVNDTYGVSNLGSGSKSYVDKLKTDFTTAAEKAATAAESTRQQTIINDYNTNKTVDNLKGSTGSSVNSFYLANGGALESSKFNIKNKELNILNTLAITANPLTSSYDYGFKTKDQLDSENNQRIVSAGVNEQNTKIAIANSISKYLNNANTLACGGKIKRKAFGGELNINPDYLQMLPDGSYAITNSNGTSNGTHESGDNIAISTSNGTKYEAEPGEVLTKSTDGTPVVLSKRLGYAQEYKALTAEQEAIEAKKKALIDSNVKVANSIKPTINPRTNAKQGLLGLAIAGVGIATAGLQYLNNKKTNKQNQSILNNYSNEANALLQSNYKSTVTGYEDLYNANSSLIGEEYSTNLNYLNSLNTENKALISDYSSNSKDNIFKSYSGTKSLINSLNSAYLDKMTYNDLTYNDLTYVSGYKDTDITNQVNDINNSYLTSAKAADSLNVDAATKQALKQSANSSKITQLSSLYRDKTNTDTQNRMADAQAATNVYNANIQGRTAIDNANIEGKTALENQKLQAKQEITNQKTTALADLETNYYSNLVSLDSNVTNMLNSLNSTYYSGLMGITSNKYSSLLNNETTYRTGLLNASNNLTSGQLGILSTLTNGQISINNANAQNTNQMYSSIGNSASNYLVSTQNDMKNILAMIQSGGVSSASNPYQSK